jgi:hypothetical protein
MIICVLRPPTCGVDHMGRPRNPPPPPERMPWHTKAIADQIDAIMTAMEISAIDAETRGIFERKLYRERYFHNDARGEIIFLIRCILESSGNEGALVGPVVSAVNGALRPEWTARGLELIEAFDQIPLMPLLETLRSVDIFREESLGHYMSIALRNKLAAILEPAVAKPAKVKQAPKPPLAVTRVPQIEKAISFGVELQAVRAAIVCNKLYSREVRKRFPDVDPITASESMRVARVYAARPEIYRAAAWAVLIELASPKMSATVRQAMEAKIITGETVTAKQIRAARGRLRGGCLKRPIQQPAPRMAA